MQGAAPRITHPFFGMSPPETSAKLSRDPSKRLSAVDALNHPWLLEADELAGESKGAGQDRPLQRSIIQRLQRFGTYSFLKQVVLSKIAGEANKISEMSPQIFDFFNSLDKDQSGTISYDELRQGLSKAGYQLADSEGEASHPPRTTTNKKETTFV